MDGDESPDPLDLAMSGNDAQQTPPASESVPLPLNTQPSDSSGKNDTSTPKARVVRQRCYPETAKGPFEVFIRQREKPINVLLVAAELHKNFRTVKEIRKISFGKVRVLFAMRDEANNVVYNELLSRLYRVYVPSDRVEIDGVIDQADLDFEYVASEGLGKFKDPRLPSVPVLECSPLVSAVTVDGQKSYVQSHSVRVTFAGTSLPDFLELHHVLIPVRLFSPKLMYCKKCKRFGHTERLCANKVRCGKCGQQNHSDEQCAEVEGVCLHCKGTHTSEKDCPSYRKRIQLARAKAMQKSKLSYAEMVRQTIPDYYDDNPFSSLSDMSDEDENVPHFSGNATHKRKKITANRSTKKSKAATFVNQPDAFPMLVSQPHSSSQAHSSAKVTHPPGFSQAGRNDTRDSGKLTISGLIQLLADIFKLDSMWIDVLTKLTPILNTLFAKLLVSWPLIGLFLTIDG